MAIILMCVSLLMAGNLEACPHLSLRTTMCLIDMRSVMENSLQSSVLQSIVLMVLSVTALCLKVQPGTTLGFAYPQICPPPVMPSTFSWSGKHCKTGAKQVAH